MTVTVAACQLAVDVERSDPSILERAVRDAASRGARLVVLPELALCGYMFASPAEARGAAEPLDGPAVTLLKELSTELGCVLVCGICEFNPSGQVYNSAVLVEDGALRACYRKVHLWGREGEFFLAGGAPAPVVDTSVGRVAVMICYDLEFPEWVRMAAEAGAEIIAAPCNWPWMERPVVERPIEVIKAQAAAGTYRIYMIVADRCGRERGTDWIGGSLICDDTGYLLAGPATAHGSTAQPAVLTAFISPSSARNKSLGAHNHALDDRRTDLYRTAEPSPAPPSR